MGWSSRISAIPGIGRSDLRRFPTQGFGGVSKSITPCLTTIPIGLAPYSEGLGRKTELHLAFAAAVLRSKKAILAHGHLGIDEPISDGSSRRMLPPQVHRRLCSLWRWSLGAALAATVSCWSAVPAIKFPVAVSGDHRLLVDSAGHPILVVGDTAWSVVAQLDSHEAERYLEDRARRGFNAIIVNLIEHKFSSKAPARRDGVQPFLAPGDFARPNAVYFDDAHRFVARARDLGMMVWLCPAYLGWGGGEEGFFREIKAAGPEVLRGYGSFLANRFKDLPNIVWMVGGDYALPKDERWAGESLALGLRDSGAPQCITAHGGQTSGVETFGDAPWLDLDTFYSYAVDMVPLLRIQDARRPRRPWVLIESTYEGEHDSRPDQIRRQAWWAVLCGAAGQFFGNNPIWHFDGPTLFPHQLSWDQALNSIGAQDMTRLGTILLRYPWHRLVPEVGDDVVTEGRGAGKEALAMAMDAARSIALIYLPSTPSRTRELALNLGSFTGPVRASWINPAKDDPARVIGTIAAKRGSWKIRSPGDNGTGTSDWLLVLESRP